MELLCWLRSTGRRVRKGTGQEKSITNSDPGHSCSASTKLGLCEDMPELGWVAFSTDSGDSVLYQLVLGHLGQLR